MRFGSGGGFGGKMILGKALPGWWRLFCAGLTNGRLRSVL